MQQVRNMSALLCWYTSSTYFGAVRYFVTRCGNYFVMRCGVLWLSARGAVFHDTVANTADVNYSICSLKWTASHHQQWHVNSKTLLQQILHILTWGINYHRLTCIMTIKWWCVCAFLNKWWVTLTFHSTHLGNKSNKLREKWLTVQLSAITKPNNLRYGFSRHSAREAQLIAFTNVSGLQFVCQWLKLWLPCINTIAMLSFHNYKSVING